MTRNRLNASDSILLVVDIQTKLFPHIFEHDRVEQQVIRALRAARETHVPIVVSEQYRDGLGATVPDVLAAAGDAVLFEKMAFSVCGDPAGLARLGALGRHQVLLVGIETHVCVQQTALDLLERGMQPFVLADAVSSRRALDRDVAFERMRQGGVMVTTVEAAVFELMQQAGTDLFKRVLPIVR